jgi:predicted TIM-barrel fold metal-dependent hydrolase
VTIDAYCTLGVDREYDLTAGVLIEAMDAAEVDRAVIAPVDRCLAVMNREGNDFVLRAAREHPRRFIPACSVNPWYGAAAEAELRRTLGEGARMLVLHPWVQGYQANDELTFPVIGIAERERVPVYVHTGQPGNSTPWQVAGLAARFAGADFLMGHSGATDFWNDAVEAAGVGENVYLESSLARPFQFAGYLGKLGAAKGIAGSCAPLNDLVFEWGELRKHVPAPMWAQVAGGNLAALLGKRGAL